MAAYQIRIYVYGCLTRAIDCGEDFLKAKATFEVNDVSWQYPALVVDGQELPMHKARRLLGKLGPKGIALSGSRRSRGGEEEI